MVEIKFRIWNTEYKKFLDDSRSLPIGRMTESAESTRDILSQFTGLLDRNGKEIYEGDIIEFNVGDKKQKCKIILFHGSWQMQKINDTGFFSNKYSRIYSYKNMIEIIGNIYENPNLLENK